MNDGSLISSDIELLLALGVSVNEGTPVKEGNMRYKDACDQKREYQN